MKTNITMKKYILALILTGVLTSCGDFLAETPDSSITTFESLAEVQALLDNVDEMNQQYNKLSEYGADTYYATTEDLNNIFFDYYRQIYVWQAAPKYCCAWSSQYSVILYANTALHVLATKLEKSKYPSEAWNNVKGSALFFRGYSFLALSQLYAPPYDAATAESALGIPLRLDPDVEAPVVRNTVQETYDRILADLRKAATLLPDLPIVNARPSKAAVFGALARTFLVMGKYDSALVNANRALQLKNDLIDYNTLDSTASAPIPRFNDEEIFFSESSFALLIHPFYSQIDTTLYNSYNNDDLRKAIFFGEDSFTPENYAFKGNYSNSLNTVYGGIATDEIYLIKAECLARAGQVTQGMQTLNTLLETRWKTGTFTPYTAAGQADAIEQIIAERKKELLFRGLRWMDIRRLIGTEFAITPKKVFEGQEYVLEPDNPNTRYTYLIPQVVIEKTGIPQNQ